MSLSIDALACERNRLSVELRGRKQSVEEIKTVLTRLRKDIADNESKQAIQEGHVTRLLRDIVQFDADIALLKEAKGE